MVGGGLPFFRSIRSFPQLKARRERDGSLSVADFEMEPLVRFHCVGHVRRRIATKLEDLRSGVVLFADNVSGPDRVVGNAYFSHRMRFT
jgi:hypothetical protein